MWHQIAWRRGVTQRRLPEGCKVIVIAGSLLEGQYFIDVGTGLGLPGIALAITYLAQSPDSSHP